MVKQLNKEQIKQIIPYSEPFLFIDRVISLEKNRIVAEKDVSNKEEFFKGHFVDFPIMPGALIVEGMGQAATLLVRNGIPNHKEKDILAYKLKDCTFKNPTFPGDVLRYEIDLVMQDERFAIARGNSFVGEKPMAECLMMLAIVQKTDFRGKYAEKVH